MIISLQAYILLNCRTELKNQLVTRQREWNQIVFP